MATLIRWITAGVLAVTLLPWAFYVLVDVWRGKGNLLPQQDPAAIGVGALIGLVLVFWKRPNAFIHTFIHEACHAILCLLLGVRIMSFRITGDQGGAVSHESVDPFRETIVSIAPYTLPLLLSTALLFRMWFDEPSNVRLALSGISALLFVHHLQALYHNVRLNMWGKQADLVKVSRPLSAVLIAIALCFTASWTVWALW